MKSYISACLKPMIVSIRDMITRCFNTNKASIDELKTKVDNLQTTLQEVQTENLNLKNQITNCINLTEGFDRNLSEQIQKIQSNTTAIQHINEILSGGGSGGSSSDDTSGES